MEYDPIQFNTNIITRLLAPESNEATLRVERARGAVGVKAMIRCAHMSSSCPVIKAVILSTLLTFLSKVRHAKGKYDLPMGRREERPSKDGRTDVTPTISA